MTNLIQPYLIGLEVDEPVEHYGPGKWAISVGVDIGDRLLLPKTRKDRKLYKRGEFSENLRGNFIILVCSEEFLRDPAEMYPRSIPYALVRDEFDLQEVFEYLAPRIEAIGVVKGRLLGSALEGLVYHDDWDCEGDQL